MEIIDDADKSSVNNIKEVAWVQQQIKVELSDLRDDIAIDSFYTKEDGDKVKYNMRVVRDYLESIQNKEWKELTAQNTSAWIMAVQIALEKLWYDTGTIDGIYAEGWTTDAAVRAFQENNDLKVDGAPGKETIHKLLEKLWEAPLDKPKEGNPGEEETSTVEEAPAESEASAESEAPADDKKTEVVSDSNRTEKFNVDKFKFLKRKVETLLPDKTSMVWSESPNPENPEFTIKINDKYNWSVVKFIKLNFHDYVNEDILNEDKLSSDIQKAKGEWYDERTFQNRILSNNKYSLEDLFPQQTNKVGLGAFFSKFRWNKLTIDTTNTCFDMYWDKLYLQFDKRGFNAAKWCDQQIDKSELKWEDWKYSQEKFKNKLRDIIIKVVDENF